MATYRNNSNKYYIICSDSGKCLTHDFLPSGEDLSYNLEGRMEPEWFENEHEYNLRLKELNVINEEE